MTKRSALARVKMAMRPLLTIFLAGALQWMAAVVAAETPTPTPTQTQTVTPQPSPTATEDAEPTPTRTPKPKPTSTPSPTPLPAHDMAVSFFNNFCEAGQPLLATVFNTSATTLESGTLRVSLFGEEGLLEEHDHSVSLGPYGTANLPLFNPATPPWMRVEIILVTGGMDSNPNNDSASCGVTAVEILTAESLQTPGASEETHVAPGTSSRAAPPPASGVGTNSVWRQALPTPTPGEAPVQATTAPLSAPSSAQPIANVPQPSLTPIGDAGGGVAPAPQKPFPSRTLMMTGVVLLAAGTSWAFYYLTRPPKNA